MPSILSNPAVLGLLKSGEAVTNVYRKEREDEDEFQRTLGLNRAQAHDQDWLEEQRARRQQEDPKYQADLRRATAAAGQAEHELALGQAVTPGMQAQRFEATTDDLISGTAYKDEIVAAGQAKREKAISDAAKKQEKQAQVEAQEGLFRTAFQAKVNAAGGNVFDLSEADLTELYMAGDSYGAGFSNSKTWINFLNNVLKPAQIQARQQRSRTVAGDTELNQLMGNDNRVGAPVAPPPGFSSEPMVDVDPVPTRRSGAPSVPANTAPAFADDAQVAMAGLGAPLPSSPPQGASLPPGVPAGQAGDLSPDEIQEVLRAMRKWDTDFATAKQRLMGMAARRDSLGAPSALPAGAF